MSEGRSRKCGYCGHTHPREEWQRTPQGRPVCPDCGAIPAEWQREPEVIV